MTPALRKYHRVVWFSFALLLPALFIAAIVSIPETQFTPQLTDNKLELTTTLRSGKSALFSLSVKADAEKNEQHLEVTIRKALTVPEALVYLSCEQSPDKVLLGKLNSKGPHTFSLPQGQSFDQCEIQFLNPFENNVFDVISL